VDEEGGIAITRSIIGLSPDHVAARRALTELSAVGFDTVHLGVVLPDTPARRDDTMDQVPADPTAEAAVSGGIIGGTAGALLAATGALLAATGALLAATGALLAATGALLAATGALLAATGALLAATGALVIPGVGPVIAGGLLASLVGGTAGWLAGSLTAQGLCQEEALEIEERVQVGRLLVIVQAQGRDAEAREILLRTGAEGLEERGAGSGATTPTPYRRMADDEAEGT